MSSPGCTSLSSKQQETEDEVITWYLRVRACLSNCLCVRDRERVFMPVNAVCLHARHKHTLSPSFTPYSPVPKAKMGTCPITHTHTRIAGRAQRRGELSFVNKELWQLAVAMGTVCCWGLVLHHKVLKLAPKPRRSHPSSTRLTSVSLSFKRIVRVGSLSLSLPHVCLSHCSVVVLLRGRIPLFQSPVWISYLQEDLYLLYVLLQLIDR